MGLVAVLRSIAVVGYDCFRSILVKKSVFGGAVYRQIKNRPFLVLLRIRHDHSAFWPNQTSILPTLFRGQISQWDFSNRVGQKRTA